MKHPIYRIIDFEKIGAYTLRVFFDDGTSQTIDFRPVLKGALYGVLQDEKLFDLVTIDPEVHTLVWPHGADFDPTILHDWPRYAKSVAEMAEKWAQAEFSVG
ncbi:MAG: DUF2442 domain-containing protein [Chloroflexi bacterium]|nr:DUF2442 domain-containing protein [Chloroflexota bacterium]